MSRLFMTLGALAVAGLGGASGLMLVYVNWFSETGTGSIILVAMWLAAAVGVLSVVFSVVAGAVLLSGMAISRWRQTRA